MTAALATKHQRSQGQIVLDYGAGGLVRLREQGAAKLRLPFGGHEAILINTGGGLAGGDEFDFTIAVGAQAKLSVTTQAAERVYRTLGPPARVATGLQVGGQAAFSWLPQETILYDGAGLRRSITAEVAEDARLLAVESFIFGRAAMGETLRSVSLRDRWRIRRGGNLIFADDIALSGALPSTAATLGNAGAMATIVLISPDAEAMVEGAREYSAASAWSGKLVARLLAQDSFDLRKSLIPLLHLLAGGIPLPKAWSL